MEMRTIQSLTSGVSKRMIHSMATHLEYHGETDVTLSQISGVYDAQNFCERLVSTVNIATAYREDLDAWEEQQRVSGVISNDRHSTVTPEEVAWKWNIGLETAKKTLKVTTQFGIHTAVHPMMRRLRVDHLHLHQHHLRGTWFADTLLSKVKSKLGNTCANIYTQGKFTQAIPMISRKDAGKSLIDFTDDVGIPERLITDGATEFTGHNTEFVKEA